MNIQQILITKHIRLMLIVLLTNTVSAAIIVERGNGIGGEALENSSGWAISLSSDGKAVAIGAPGNSDSAPFAGHTRVYTYDSNGGIWMQKGDDIDGESESDSSGHSVSINEDGSIVAIGSPFNSGNGDSSGHVRVFGFDNNTDNWIQLGDNLDGEFEGDQFGFSISINGDGTTLAVGAHQSDLNGSNSGTVRVYQYNSAESSWIQIGNDIYGDSTGDQLGQEAVALNSSGNTVAISSRFNSESAFDAGQVKILKYSELSEEWEQIGNNIGGEALGDRSGNSVSINSIGNIVAIGARENDGNGINAGHVRVYMHDESNNIWNQLGDDIDGYEQGEQFGFSVSLDSIGKTLLAGGPGNDENGGDSGAARLYQYKEAENNWIQLGSVVYGQASDATGRSVSLNGDGNFLAIASPFNSNVDFNAGIVYHYEVLYSYSDIATNPSSFDLVNTESVEAARISGQAEVVNNPNSFNLYNETDLSASEGIAFLEGEASVIATPNDYSLFSQTDLNNERISAQAEVVDNPNSFNLYNETDLSAAEGIAFLEGEASVIATPNDYSLFSQTDLNNARSFVNLSARVHVGASDSVIPGFVVLGENKEILIRAVGPKLADLGVDSPLPDPTMRIVKSATEIEPALELAVVDNWTDDGDVEGLKEAMASVGAFPLDPASDFQGRELPTDDTTSAATILTLSTGIYTIVVSSSDGGEGEVLVEAYEKLD